MHYYGTRLSENISKREPEGYLLCLNVPVARTGTQDYLPEELGLDRSLSRRDSAPRSSLASADLTSDGISATGGPQRFAQPSFISVFRPEEEVFSPETIASFEGMPVTNDHPPEGVDVTNIRALQKGHAHNVRRGSGAEADLLLADLIITDPALITAILEDGKREISCGYTYELCEENGQYIQRQIRGNHVAVVDAGRAGSRVSIKDHQPERRKNTMKKSLSKVLARMAKDGDIETVAGIIEEMLEPENEAPEQIAEPVEAEAAGEEAPVVENAETVIAVDGPTLADVVSRLDRIIALLEPAPAADEDPAAEEIAEAVEEVIEAMEAADPASEQIAAAMEEVLDPVSSVVLEEEEEEEPSETLPADDALRAALAAVRPVLMKMPLKARKQMAGDIAARIRRAEKRGTTGADAYAALVSARKRTAPVSAELGRRIMEKRNISYVRN